MVDPRNRCLEVVHHPERVIYMVCWLIEYIVVSLISETEDEYIRT